MKYLALALLFASSAHAVLPTQDQLITTEDALIDEKLVGAAIIAANFTSGITTRADILREMGAPRASGQIAKLSQASLPHKNATQVMIYTYSDSDPYKTAVLIILLDSHGTFIEGYFHKEAIAQFD